MDIDSLISIIALCIACFMAGVQYGKGHKHKNDRHAKQTYGHSMIIF